ncbi:MAG TPA: T9SS type A sorting domain-containing protein [Bacteroidia bacterium]|nr:T9SS type A sorting domain-containing protein [Bacteroidia bacterium]
MKKHIIILTILFLTLTVVRGQTGNWLWAKAGTITNGNAEGMSNATDNFGNVYITGFFQDSVITFGNFTLVNNNTSGNTCDIFIVKYDANGNVIWAKSAGGTSADDCYSICTDASCNFFITGSFESLTCTFGGITINRSSTSVGDVFIAKYDSSGNALWAKSSTGNSYDIGSSVSTDVFGNALITGRFGSSAISIGSYTLSNVSSNDYDVFIAKYDVSGNVMWANSAGGIYWDGGWCTGTDASGNIYLTGSYDSPSITFGSFTLTNVSVGSRQFFLVKYNAAGNVLWAKSIGGNAHEDGWSVTTDGLKNVFLTGGFQSPVINIGNITLTNSDPSGHTFDMFVVKFDSSGNSLWAKSAGATGTDDVGYCVSVDNLGNVFATGSFYSPTIIFGSDTITMIQGSNDPIFIVKYDHSGKVLCCSALTSGGDDQDGISVDAMGNAYITGDYRVSPFIIGSNTLPLLSGESIFTAKFQCNSDAAINFISENPATKIFPNPFSSKTILQMDKNLKDATLTLYNSFGQQVKQIKNISGQTIIVQRDNLSCGLYFLQLTQDNTILTTDKLVIVDN